MTRLNFLVEKTEEEAVSFLTFDWVLAFVIVLSGNTVMILFLGRRFFPSYQRRFLFPEFCEQIKSLEFSPDFEWEREGGRPLMWEEGSIRLVSKDVIVLFSRRIYPLQTEISEDILFERSERETYCRWIQVKVVGNKIKFFTIGNTQINHPKAAELTLLSAVVEHARKATGYDESPPN